MKSLADDLPAEIAQQVHPDWRANEAAYWAARDGLLKEFANQWVGFADGKVIASGTSPVAVSHAAAKIAGHPYVVCVGHEDEGTRMRRVAFAYDQTYPGEPLPVCSVEFRPVSGVTGFVMDQVVLDTGADATALPWADCQKMGLDPSRALPRTITGVAGGTATSLEFLIWSFLDGKEYQCRLQADFTGSERILGRDVLNALEALFRGPSGEAVVNP